MMAVRSASDEMMHDAQPATTVDDLDPRYPIHKQAFQRQMAVLD